MLASLVIAALGGGLSVIDYARSSRIVTVTNGRTVSATSTTTFVSARLFDGCLPQSGYAAIDVWLLYLRSQVRNDNGRIRGGERMTELDLKLLRDKMIPRSVRRDAGIGPLARAVYTHSQILKPTDVALIMQAIATHVHALYKAGRR
jgi:hypothetical protein